MYHANEAAERSVLGTIIAEGSKAFAIAATRIPVAAAFTLRDRRVLWGLLEHMAKHGQPIEAQSVVSTAFSVQATTLDERLPDTLAVELIGGELGEVTRALVSMSTLEHQADLVGSAWKRRAYLRWLIEAADKAKAADCDPEAIHGDIGQKWRAITAGGADAVCSLADMVADRTNLGGTPAGSWGVPILDDYAPLVSGRNYVIAAPPGFGKSTLGLQANIASAARGFRSWFLSMEMDKSDFQARAPGAAKAFGDPSELLDLVRVVTEPGGIPANRVQVLFERAEADGAAFVVVDYLGRFKKSHPAQNDFEKINEASAAIAEATKRTGVSAITLSQMTRGSRAQRQSKSGTLEGMSQPQMGDLRGSGDIEQDANWIGILWNPEPIPEEAQDIELGLQICKDRHSPHAGKCLSLEWARSQYRFKTHVETAPSHSDRFEQAPTDDEDLFA